VRRLLPVLALVLGFTLHLVVGFVYAASGLVVPVPWLFALWALWGGLAAVAVARRRQPLFVLLIPFVALALLLVITSLGGYFLHWQA
jgi:hypothetical protein